MEPFERVVADHGSVVWRVCRGLLAEHDAEDAWAETFAAALAAWGRADQHANVRGWLVTIAHRKAIDVLRSRARDPLPIETLRIEMSGAETLPGGTLPGQTRPGPALPEHQSRYGVPGARDLDLWAALATLPPKQRAAVVHHHLGGLPYDQVAELTGGTSTAARRAAADGIARLRTILRPPTEQPPEHPPKHPAKQPAKNQPDKNRPERAAPEEAS